MDDLDICKRIAEIEGYKTEAFSGHDCCAFTGNDCEPYVGKYDYIPYNPLKNDTLCFQLMVKYKVDFCNLENHVYEAICGSTFFQNRNPNKAICLAIIKANK